MRVLIALLVAALVPLAGTVAPATPAAAASRATTPNVVFVLTDDMRLDDLRYMPFTRRLFRRQGTDFTHALSPHPMCCPARASLVTGQYAQNNGVHHNRGDWGGYGALGQNDDLVFRWFRRAGYKTSYVGKFMNGYRGQEDIPGLLHNNMAIKHVYSPHGLITYNNGQPARHRQHQTVYTTRYAKAEIKRFAGDPFFLWAGYVAPHMMPNGKGGWGPPVPPAGYGKFRRRSDRRPPSVHKASFNVRHPVLGLDKVSRRTIRRTHRGRVLSLYAVDDGVRQIVRTLKKQGVYRDTILAFASDNGYGMGSHRVKQKNSAYQDVVRVPLMLAGPGVPSAHVESAVTTLVDLPGTLASLTGVEPMRVQDGGNLFEQPADRAVLIQAGDSARQWLWRGVYTPRYTYVRWSRGDVELYDRAGDPDELDNRPGDPVALRLQALAERLGACAGAACQATFD